MSGAISIANTREYPCTTTGLPGYDTEDKIYAKYILRTLPRAKIGILFQNDDVGKDFVASSRETFKAWIAHG